MMFFAGSGVPLPFYYKPFRDFPQKEAFMKKNRIIIAALFLALMVFTGCNEAEPEASTQPVLMDTTGKYELTESGEAIVTDVSHLSSATVAKEDNHRVFYQIFVCSFSDSNGDGVGDLRGIINRFDYLNDGNPDSGTSLGVEGIWLSPIFKSPSYHKYDVTDYYTIDESYGTMEDLKELVALCHERNVKLILDVPINHTGSQNEWFKKFCSAHRKNDTESEYYDFYCYGSVPKQGTRTFSKIASSDDYYESNFSGDMPELNFDNEAVYEAVVDIARYYLEDIGVDGFRFDAAKYIYFGDNNKCIEFWKRYMDSLTAIKPDIYVVGEVWDSDSVTVPYIAAMNCFDFSVSQVEGRIAETAKLGDVNIYTAYVDKYITQITGQREDAMYIPFIANHDTDRAAGYMTLASGYAKVAANLYILGPGSPIIYYGEEIGLKGSRGGSNTDANRRLKMLWGDDDTVKSPEGADFDESKQTNGTVMSQKGSGDSLYNYYKRLLAIRKANPEIYLGTYEALSLPDTKVGGFLSTYEGTTVGVFHNTTGSAVTIDLSAVTDVKFNGIADSVGLGSASLDGTSLTIEAQTSVVLR